MAIESTSIAGTCPRCETELHTRSVLIEYETSDGATNAFAECPSCHEVVHPR